MKQIVSKGGKIYCVTTVPYPDHIIRSMKKVGYKVKNVEDEKEVPRERRER